MNYMELAELKNIAECLFCSKYGEETNFMCVIVCKSVINCII